MSEAASTRQGGKHRLWTMLCILLTLCSATLSHATRNRVLSPQKSTSWGTTEEFRRFGIHFHQDMDLFVDRTDEHAMVAYGLGNLDATQQTKLKKFLTELLRENLSDEQLGDLWEATGTDIYFSRGLRQFLALVRDTIPD